MNGVTKPVLCWMISWVQSSVTLYRKMATQMSLTTSRITTSPTMGSRCHQYPLHPLHPHILLSWGWQFSLHSQWEGTLWSPWVQLMAYCSLLRTGWHSAWFFDQQDAGYYRSDTLESSQNKRWIEPVQTEKARKIWKCSVLKLVRFKSN